MLFVLSLLAFGCSKVSKESVKTALVGQSYYLINSPKDSAQVQFFENCSRHYTWDVFIVDEWELKEDGSGKIILYYDTHDFTPKPVGDDEFEFICEKTGQRLVKAKPVAFNAEALNGTWEDAHYVGASPGTPLPACEGKQAMVPGYTFKTVGCTVRNFCESHEAEYLINPAFNSIIIGDQCSSVEHLRIFELTPTKLVVEREHELGGKMTRDINLWFVKKNG